MYVLKVKPKENMANLSLADGSMTVSDKAKSEGVVFPFKSFVRPILECGTRPTVMWAQSLRKNITRGEMCKDALPNVLLA